jgi:diacylglycerol kinase family enzyme
MIYILYNPLANGGNGTVGLEKVQAAFPGQCLDQQDITKLDTRAFLTGLSADDRVILCGGDGTINHLINAIADTPIAVPISIWKFGTGNDFWRDVPEKGDHQTVLLNDYIQNLPYAMVDGQKVYFLNNCSYGLDGKVCEIGEHVKRHRKKGKVSYAWLAIRSILRDYHCGNADVTVDGETRHYEKVWMASALNGRFVGGGMKLAPDQDRTSDKLCCLVWHGTSRLATLCRLVSVFWGGHVKWKHMCDVRFGRDIQVVFDRPTAAQLDGEVFSDITGYTAHK